MGFRQRPWTTDELFYIPFTVSSNIPRRSATNYTTGTFGMGTTLRCEEIPQELINTWTLVHFGSNKPDLPGRYKSFSVPAFNSPPKDKGMLALVFDIDNRTVQQEPALFTSFFARGYFNESSKDLYIGNSHRPYPAALADGQDWDFYSSWHRYEYDRNRQATINRHYYNTTPPIDRTLLERDSPYLGKTIEGPSLFIQSRVSLRCRVTPRLVRSTLTSDLEGHIIRHEDTNIPLAADTLTAANLSYPSSAGMTG